LISLTFATEIGDVCRFSSASKLVGYAGLAPRISQSGERSVTGRLSKAGSRTLRWAAVEAANRAWRPNNPFHVSRMELRGRGSSEERSAPRTPKEK
jgi:transposase